MESNLPIHVSLLPPAHAKTWKAKWTSLSRSDGHQPSLSQLISKSTFFMRKGYEERLWSIHIGKPYNRQALLYHSYWRQTLFLEFNVVAFYGLFIFFQSLHFINWAFNSQSTRLRSCWDVAFELVRFARLEPCSGFLVSNHSPSLCQLCYKPDTPSKLRGELPSF